MKITNTYLTWGLVCLALLSWSGVIWEIHSIALKREARTSELESGAKNASDASARLRAVSLAKETESERAALTALISTDIVAASDLIASAGRNAGVTLKLSGALPEQAPSARGAALDAVGFEVQADGRFSTLMRALEALESLPIPSSVSRFDVERGVSEQGTSELWHLDAHVVILTNADSL